MPLSPTSRTAPSSFLVALVSVRPMTTATASPASPAMPSSSSMTVRSLGVLTIKIVMAPTPASDVMTVTSATRVSITPMDRSAISFSSTTPMIVVTTAMAPTDEVTCTRSDGATSGMMSPMAAIMPTPARTGTRRPRP